MEPPFGWIPDPSGKQRLVVYEPEAIVVRTVFQLAHNGSTPSEIADLFNEFGISDPGERMHDRDYVSRYFQYMGWEHPEIEPIIDPKQFAEVQEKIGARTAPRKGKRRRSKR